MCQSVEELWCTILTGHWRTPTPQQKNVQEKDRSRGRITDGGVERELGTAFEVCPGPAFSSYLENRLRSDCVRIMMTGRVYKLSARVTECLSVGNHGDMFSRVGV